MRLYRAALRAYPSEYRRARGEEILGTLAEAYGDRRPSLAELAALVRAGVGERDRADLAAPGASWRRALAALAVPLACVNAAIALVGLRLAWPEGPGLWWPAFALVACTLAVATAARLRVAAPLLGFASLALIARDAVTMAGDGGTVPHVRLLEHVPPSGSVPFPPLPATVPSNPTELVPFAIVLAIACLCVRPAALGAFDRAVRAALSIGTVAALAGLALVFPDYRFSWLLVPALAVGAGALVTGVVYRRALIVGIALLVAIAPSVFWYLSRGYPIEHWDDYGLTQTSATRDIVPGLIGLAAMAIAAATAIVLARGTPGRAG